MGGCKSNMGQRPPCGNSQRAFPREKTRQTEKVQIPETEGERKRLTGHAEPRFPCSVFRKELGLMLRNSQRHESTNSFFPVLKAVWKRSLSVSSNRNGSGQEWMRTMHTPAPMVGISTNAGSLSLPWSKKAAEPNGEALAQQAHGPQVHVT